MDTFLAKLQSWMRNEPFVVNMVCFEKYATIYSCSKGEMRVRCIGINALDSEIKTRVFICGDVDDCKVTCYTDNPPGYIDNAMLVHGIIARALMSLTGLGYSVQRVDEDNVRVCNPYMDGVMRLKLQDPTAQPASLSLLALENANLTWETSKAWKDYQLSVFSSSVLSQFWTMLDQWLSGAPVVVPAPQTNAVIQGFATFKALQLELVVNGHDRWTDHQTFFMRANGYVDRFTLRIEGLLQHQVIAHAKDRYKMFRVRYTKRLRELSFMDSKVHPRRTWCGCVTM